MQTIIEASEEYVGKVKEIFLLNVFFLPCYNKVYGIVL